MSPASDSPAGPSERCGGCGAAVEGDAAFCTSCGAPTGPTGGAVAIPGHVLVERLREDEAGATWSARHATAGVLRLLRVESGAEAGRHGGVLERSPILLRLDHPALASVHDVIALPDGGVGLLADLPRGRPLSTLARSFGALPLREVVAVLRPLVEALEAARAAGAPLAAPSPEEVCVEREGRGWRVELAPVRLAPQGSSAREEAASVALLAVILLTGDVPEHPERRERLRLARAATRDLELPAEARTQLQRALDPRGEGPSAARDVLVAVGRGLPESGGAAAGGATASRTAMVVLAVIAVAVVVAGLAWALLR